MRKVITLGMLVATVALAGTTLAETGNTATSRLLERLSRLSIQQVQPADSPSAFQGSADIR